MDQGPQMNKEGAKQAVLDLERDPAFTRIGDGNDRWHCPGSRFEYGLINAHSIWKASKGLAWWQDGTSTVADALAARLRSKKDG